MKNNCDQSPSTAAALNKIVETSFDLSLITIKIIKLKQRSVLESQRKAAKCVRKHTALFSTSRRGG